MNRFIKSIIILLVSSFIFSQVAIAGPISTSYELKQYGFGSGGTEGATSTTYSMFGTGGEIDASHLQSTTYDVGGGLVYTLLANVPSAPAFTNPSNNYDRLHFVINDGGNPTDTTFAISISTDNFVSNINYVHFDLTVGSALNSGDWLTSSVWGATSEYITGLLPNTTYYLRVKARQGNFTESAWSASSNVATSVASLTFGISSSTVAFSNLNSGNSYTDNSKTTVLTTSTNAYNGYIIYGRDTSVLDATIPNYTSPNSAPTTWSGTGFGYTTSDNNLSGGTANRFTNGGPKYAGFTTTAPGDPVGDHAGPVLTAISSEPWTITYNVTAASTTNAGTYRTTVLYVVVPWY